MKELTIQEKAKAYDEAIQKLRGMMPNWERLFYNGKTFLQDLIYIFPELKEPDDERIREALIDFFRRGSENGEQTNGIFDKDILAWLEKQSEHNHTWSEEDERLCQCLIEDQEEALDEVRNDKYGHSEIISDLKEMYHERIDWLKSLKERVQPQSKQKWSKYDEEIRVSMIEDYTERVNSTLNVDLANYFNKCIDFLKNKNTWKPSDKQMGCLCEALNKSTGNVYDGLKSLFDELQNLK